MIKSKNTATIESVEKGLPKLVLDVFFNKKNPKWVRVTVGGSKTKVLIDDLFSFMFFMATPGQQVNLIPVQKIEKPLVEFVRQHSVRVEKDLKKGEMLTFNCNVKVDELVANQIRMEQEEKLKKTKK